MTIKWDELPDARRSSAIPPSYQTAYLLAGIFDSEHARLQASLLLPPYVVVHGNVLTLNQIECQEIGFKLYHVHVSYSASESLVPGQAGFVGFNFSTTGGSFHITHSKSTVAMYTTSGTAAPDNNQAINVKHKKGEDDIEGTDLVIPALKLTYTFRHPKAVVNEVFSVRLARATSCVNSEPFRGFQAGEVLFLGADGSSGTNAESEVKYQFAAEQNLSGLIFNAIDGDNPSGQIAGVAKDGHDFLWIRWVDATTGASGTGNKTTKPKQIYIERLYQRINFAATFGWG